MVLNAQWNPAEVDNRRSFTLTALGAPRSRFGVNVKTAAPYDLEAMSNAKNDAISDAKNDAVDDAIKNA